MPIDPSPWGERLAAGLARWRDDVVAAALFLTRLPLGAFAIADSGLLARSMRAFPLVGIVVGLVGWAAYAVAAWLGLPDGAGALLAVLATVTTTGGLHEDGLADTADGFGGGRDRERKLAIMRDSRSGAYGVLAIVFSVALRATALTALAAVGPALIAAHAVSRAALPLLMRQLPPARSDGLGAGAGEPGGDASRWCLVLALVIAVLCLGLGRGLAALLVTAIAIALFAALARRQIGGYTGDVLGAAQQIGEIVMLLSAAAA